MGQGSLSRLDGLSQSGEIYRRGECDTNIQRGQTAIFFGFFIPVRQPPNALQATPAWRARESAILAPCCYRNMESRPAPLR